MAHQSVSPAKPDKPIEMTFRLWNCKGQRNHVLVGAPDTLREGVLLEVIIGHAGGQYSPPYSLGAAGSRHIQLNYHYT